MTSFLTLPEASRLRQVSRFLSSHCLSGVTAVQLKQPGLLPHPVLELLVSSQARLQTLSLAHQYSFKELDLSLLAGLCEPALEELRVSFCPGFTDRHLAAFLQPGKSPSVCCPALSRVTLSGTGVSGEGLLALRCCGRSLQSLSLPCCDALLDSGLAAIAARCPSLIHLELSGCTAVTADEGLMSIVQSQAGPKLQSLSLRQASLSRGFLEALATRCQALRSLDLSYTRGNPDCLVGLVAVFRWCSWLQDLSLKFCNLVSDELLLWDGGLFTPSSALRRLDLSCCDVFTTEGLLQAFAGEEHGAPGKGVVLPHLECLNLLGCNSLTTDGVAQLLVLLESQQPLRGEVRIKC